MIVARKRGEGSKKEQGRKDLLFCGCRASYKSHFSGT